jgi:hypothetical protein
MFFKKSNANKKLKKSVAIYISQLHKQVIICPRHINNAGLRYEQENCTLLNFPVDYTTLGDEVLRNFDLFSLKDKNLRDQKRTDWPAFKCSKLKTVKSFEDTFLSMNIAGNNESNIILSIEAPLSGHDDIIINSNISSGPLNKKAIGERIIKVYNLAITNTSTSEV